MVGLGNLEVIKSFGELGTEETKTGRGLFDFGDQRRAASRFCRFEGNGKA